MNKIIELDTDFFSGHYEEFNEFVALTKCRSHVLFLRELYGFVKLSDYGKYKVTDEVKLTIFMMKYPEFIEKISYE